MSYCFIRLAFGHLVKMDNILLFHAKTTSYLVCVDSILPCWFQIDESALRVQIPGASVVILLENERMFFCEINAGFDLVCIQPQWFTNHVVEYGQLTCITRQDVLPPSFFRLVDYLLNFH